MNRGKQYMSKRDFIWIFIILVLAIILVCSIRLSDNQNIIDIFSFMSNGVSIALALVAIGFAFYQSLQSETQSKEMMRTLNTIQLQVSNIISYKASEYSISNESKDELESIKTTINRINKENISNPEVQKTLDELKDKVDILKEKQIAYGEHALGQYNALRDNFKNDLDIENMGRRILMGKIFNGDQRIEVLGFELIALIAKGRKEQIHTIEEQIQNCNVVKYLAKNYKEDMFVELNESCPYGIEDWEELFSNYSGWIEGNEARKFGITNQDDGLLLLLGLILDIIQSRKSK